jgi:hypothetical protein
LQPNPTSGILPVIPLHHNQPSSTFAITTNNIPFAGAANHIPMPNNTNPQVKTKTNPPPPPPQQTDVFPTHDTILTIIRGSNTNFDTKRQCCDYYRQVNHIAGESPITQTKWSHMPLTFSSQEVKLSSFPHTDAMVITVLIDIWDVTKILIDNGSQAEILFSTAFDKMGFD